MRTYKRVKIEGGCYFFTLTLDYRQVKDLLIKHVDDSPRLSPNSTQPSI